MSIFGRNRRGSFDFDTFAAYEGKFPRSAKVRVLRDGKYFVAVISEINGKKLKNEIATQGKDDSEILLMINDAIQAYLNLPESIRANIPPLLPENFAKNKNLNGNLEFAKA